MKKSIQTKQSDFGDFETLGMLHQYQEIQRLVNCSCITDEIVHVRIPESLSNPKYTVDIISNLITVSPNRIRSP